MKEFTGRSNQRSIVTVNGGSSSIKWARYGMNSSLHLVERGAIERLGLPEARLIVNGATRPVQASSPEKAVKVVMDVLAESMGKDPGAICAVVHRVVHGGPDYLDPQRVTPALVQTLRGLASIDPQHLPMALRLIEAFQERYSRVPQVACFDTTFHQGMPRVATLLPLPRRFDKKGIRRYGFHGLSFSYLMSELHLLAGKEAAHGRIILAHLGNGASLAAVRDGKPVDTSMGFTPMAGVPMGTRSGDLDPGLVYQLMQTNHMDPKQFQEMISLQSGLLGVSETSSDMCDLLKQEHHDNRAAEAIALFCYQVKKWIGAFAAALGGLDMLIFSGGIGENAPTIRARICQDLAFLGIELDAEQNEANSGVISESSDQVEVRVIPTDEEWTMATTACRILNLSLGKDNPNEK